MARRKTRMYEPWGYREENNYQSDENIIINDLESFFADTSYNKDDNKIHFFNKDGEEKATIDVSEFVKSDSIIDKVEYNDGILKITFTNGDVITINLSELLDENEFKDGLIVDNHTIKVLIDSTGEPYLSVSENGVKISGIDAAIKVETDRAKDVEVSLNTKIENEISRATSAETVITTNLNNEITRANAAEEALDAKLDKEIQDRKDDVDAEETRAKAAETVLSQQITTLNSELDAEESIREAADVALGRRIDQEIADRKADVDAEETRATTAEATLNGRVDNLINELQPLLNDTLVTTNDKEAALGKYNVSNTSEDASGRTIFSIGNGTADNARSNALEVRENGDIYMWIEGDFIQVNNLIGMLAHEVYDTNANNNHNMNYDG